MGSSDDEEDDYPYDESTQPQPVSQNATIRVGGKGTGKKRGSYNPPTLSMIKAAFKDLLAGKELKQTAKDHKINPNTLSSRWTHYGKTGCLEKKKAGARKKAAPAFTTAMYNWVCRYVDRNSIASHDEIYEQFSAKFGKEITAADVKTYLQKNFRITLRRHKTFPTQSALEPPATNEKAYLHTLFDQGVNPKRCVFIGESAYDINPKRSYGDNDKRQHRAEKALEAGKTIAFRQKRELEVVTRLSFLAAVHHKGIIHQNYQLFEKTSDDVAIKFLKAVLMKMEEADFRNWDIIFDDAPVETKALLKPIVEGAGHRAFFLPCYTFSLNPVDMLFEHVELTCGRHTANVTTNFNDSIFCRMDSTLANSTVNIIRTCITARFKCCHDCDHTDLFRFRLLPSAPDTM